jgi:ankyrin repeat protein
MIVLLAGITLAGGVSGRTFLNSARANGARADQVFTDARAAQLAAAAGEGDAAKVHELVAAGADPNAQGDRGTTLLEWALLQQSPKGLVALLDNGADAARPGIGGATVVHMAAMANDPVYLKTLLDHGASPDTPHGVTQAPPLDAALMNPRDDAFHLLMAHHADPNRADRLGNTPLHVAAKVHKTRCVLQLLQAGADPGRRNQQGATFQTYFNITPAGGLNAVARAEHEQVDQWLRQHGVAVERGVQ